MHIGERTRFSGLHVVDLNLLVPIRTYDLKTNAFPVGPPHGPATGLRKLS